MLHLFILNLTKSKKMHLQSALYNNHHHNNRPLPTKGRCFDLPAARQFIRCAHRIDFKSILSHACFAVTELFFQTFHWYRYGNTQLHYSSLFHSQEIVKKHITSELINKDNWYGETALMLASKVNTLEVVELLVESDAHLEAKDLKGKNALLHAAGSETTDSVNIAEYLVGRGLDPASSDYEQNFGTHLAAASGNLEMLQLFHRHNVPFDEYNAKDSTPLMMAAFNRRLENTEFLIEVGADIHKRKAPTAYSAFENALLGKREDIISLFLERGMAEIAYTSKPATEKNEMTLLFESIVSDILKSSYKVDFVQKYNNGLWDKTIVKFDNVEYPLLDIFKNIQWDLIRFEDDQYLRNPYLPGKYIRSTQFVPDHIFSRVMLEEREKRIDLWHSYVKKYEKLNVVDMTIINAATGILSREMNTVLAGRTRPLREDESIHGFNLRLVVASIGLLANALNKIEPEIRKFAFRGQANKFKNNDHNAPLFISVTDDYKVATIYATEGETVRVESRGQGHVVFLKDVKVYDISGLSCVPSAKEGITLPSLITYSEGFERTKESGHLPYYFGGVKTANE